MMTATRLDIELFGGPRVVPPDGPVALSPYQAALVALVYGHEAAGLTRKEVAWLMWEADDDARARQRIRQLLLMLRRRLGAHVVQTTADRLRPATSIASDLQRFREHVASGALRDAADLLSRGFAASLTEMPCEAYEDWAAAKAVALRHDLRESSARQWDRRREQGDWPAARDAAEALYLLDRDDEATVRRVIEARAATTSPGAAEAAYAAFVESLNGTDPSPEIVELMGRVRSLDKGPIDARKSPRDDAPLVGRRDDLARARKALEQVADGAFEVVLISGESGIGKTRVLEELRREAHLAGFRCLSARPVELERRIPLNPLLDALRETDVAGHIRELEEPWRAVLSALFPASFAEEATPAIPRIQESSLSRRLLDAFAQLFESIAAEERTLLFIDDLQWADATTIAVLQFVQRRWSGGPLGVVATIRPELVSAEDDAASYLSNSPELPITHIELGELTTEEGARLVDHLTPESIDDSIKVQLCDLGGRTPFYLVELTKDYIAGRLELPAVPVEAIAVPISLQQIFEARVAQLTATASRCVGVLAAWARPMRLDSLATISGLTLDACADCVEELARWRLVRLDRDTVGMAHELFRSAAYRHLSEARKAVLHRTLAEHLVSHFEDPNPGELAIHYAKAGEASPAARYGREAADRAFENGAMSEAAYFYGLVTDNEQDPALRAEATADLAQVLYLARALGKANPLFEVAASRLRQMGNQSRALRMAVLRVHGLKATGDLSLTDLIDSLAAIKHEAVATDDWEAVALALDAELGLQDCAGDSAAVQDVFRQMRDCVGRGSPEADCICGMGLAMLILYGDPNEALEAGRSAVAIATADPAARQYLLRAQNRLLVVLIHRGMHQLPETMALSQEVRHTARSSGDLWVLAAVEGNLGLMHLDAGNLELAEDVFRRTDRLLDSGDLRHLKLNHLSNRGELALAMRDYDRAELIFREAEQLLRPGLPPYQWDYVRAGLGLCALHTARLSDARRREAELRGRAPPWHFDPTLIVQFRGELLYRRGCHLEALEYVRAQAANFSGRLPTVWLKLRLIELRLARRMRLAELRELATEAKRVAEDLRMPVRAVQAAEFLLDG